MQKKVKISGMMCVKCAGRVKKALAALDENVEVSHEKGCAMIDANVADDAIREAVTAAGYTVTGIE